MIAHPTTYGATASEATVYHYQDPRTGQTIASLLPPDHPQMVCLQAGQHVPETRYGFLGAFLRTKKKNTVPGLTLWLWLFDFDRFACRDRLVPTWYRSVFARPSRTLPTLWRVDRGRYLQLIEQTVIVLLFNICCILNCAGLLL